MSSYYADVLESMIRAWQHPRDGERIFTDLLERFKNHLERSGDSVERAILEFNQGLVALRRRSADAGRTTRGERIVDALRSLADVATNEAWEFQDRQRRPDLQALQRQLEALIAKLRGFERNAGGAPRRDTGSSPADPSDT